jgi:hypothetical protein
VGLRNVFEIGGAILLSVGGAGAVLFALSSWLGKVWAARILEQDRKKYSEELEAIKEKHSANLSRLNGELEATNRRLQAELDKSTHVYRIQFEKEFQALVEIWKAVSEVRSKITHLRPIMSLGPSDRTQALEALERRFRVFREAMFALQSAIYDQGPFYDERVYDEVKKLLMIAKSEDLEMQLSPPEPLSFEWFKAGEKHRTDFVAQADIVSGAMRARLAQLAVYGDSH